MEKIVQIARYGRGFGFAREGKEAAPCTLEKIEGEMVARVYGTTRILSVSGYDGNEYEFRQMKKREKMAADLRQQREKKTSVKPIFGATPEEIAKFNVETATVAPKAVPSAKGGWITDPKTGKKIRSNAAIRLALALGAKLS